MRYEDLGLPGQLLLLGLEDRKGTLSWRASAWFDYALAGALLAELHERSAISIDARGGLSATHDAKVGEPLLMSVLDRIRESPGVTARAWVATLPTTLDLLHEESEELVRRNVLERHTGRVLFLFHRTTYPLRDATPEKQLLEAVRLSVTDTFDVPRRMATLIAIANACGVLPDMPAPESEEVRANRLADFTAASPIGAATVAAIDDAMKAISIASSAALLPP